MNDGDIIILLIYDRVYIFWFHFVPKKRNYSKLYYFPIDL